jgi:hypothetical protein
MLERKMCFLTIDTTKTISDGRYRKNFEQIIRNDQTAQE